MYFFNITRHHIIFTFNTKQPISSVLYEVMQKSLKVWAKCDYFEALHIEMHVQTSNLNIDPAPPTLSSLPGLPTGT